MCVRVINIESLPHKIKHPPSLEQGGKRWVRLIDLDNQLIGGALVTDHYFRPPGAVWHMYLDTDISYVTWKQVYNHYGDKVDGTTGFDPIGFLEREQWYVLVGGCVFE